MGTMNRQVLTKFMLRKIKPDEKCMYWRQPAKEHKKCPYVFSAYSSEESHHVCQSNCRCKPTYNMFGSHTGCERKPKSDCVGRTYEHLPWSKANPATMCICKAGNVNSK